MFKSNLKDREYLSIIDLLKFYGLNFRFICEVIKIIKGEKNTFYSLKSFSQLHPEVYMQSSSTINEKIKDHKDLTHYENHEETVTFVRYKAGMKQLKSIIEIIIKYKFLNKVLLEDVLKVLETTVASDGKLTKNFKTSKNEKEIFQIKKIDNSNNYEIMLFSIFIDSENKKGFFYDTSTTTIKYNIKIKKFNSLKELIYYSQS